MEKLNPPVMPLKHHLLDNCLAAVRRWSLPDKKHSDQFFPTFIPMQLAASTYLTDSHFSFVIQSILSLAANFLKIHGKPYKAS